MPVPAPLTSQNVGHYDAPLTAFSLAYMQSADGFVATKVFPVVPVALASGVYPSWPRGNFFRDDVAVRPMGGRTRVQGVNVTWASYAIEEEGLSATIDDRERANQTDPINTERAKTKMLMSQHLIHADRKWAAAYFKTSVWSADVAGHATTNDATNSVFWNLTTSDPVKEVRKRKRQIAGLTGMTPNTLVIGSDVELALLDNAAIVARISGGATTANPALIAAGDLERAFGLRVLVARGIYNTANEGATESMSYIVGSKAALLVYAPPAPALEEPSAGYTFAWSGLLGGQAAGVTVRRWREEPSRSDWIEASTAHTQKLVAADLGIYFTAIVQ
jgi:hypothetical protein